MIILEDQLKKILLRNKKVDLWVDPLNKVLPKYKINTRQRVAAFFSQTCIESADFTVLEENLNYSAKGLDKTFAKYFSKVGVDPSEYAKNPKKIADYVYANRMGNGSVESGDGFRYRGRGLIQVTGKDNYKAFANHVGMELGPAMQYITSTEGALVSACWFWASNDLNSIADSGDITKLTRRVNGGKHALADRRQKYKDAFNALSAFEESYVAPCRIGSTGSNVMVVQSLLGIPADGIFGPTTESAVKKFQSKNGLKVDGIVGTITINVLVAEKS